MICYNRFWDLIRVPYSHGSINSRSLIFVSSCAMVIVCWTPCASCWLSHDHSIKLLMTIGQEIMQSDKNVRVSGKHGNQVSNHHTSEILIFNYHSHFVLNGFPKFKILLILKYKPIFTVWNVPKIHSRTPNVGW
jgi:hypothetical protein